MDEQVESEQVVDNEDGNSLLETTRRMLLASVGAVVMVQESAGKQVNSFMGDVEAFVGKLVERGEIAEKDGRQLINDVVEKQKAAAQKLASSAKEKLDSAESSVTTQLKIDKPLNGVIERLNMPTRDDIDTLTKKIAALNRKVDRYKAERDGDKKKATKSSANGSSKSAEQPKQSAKPKASKRSKKADKQDDASSASST